MSTDSNMDASLFYDQTSTFHKTCNTLTTDIVSLMIDASSTIRHPVLSIPLQRSEDPNQKMYQLPAERLWKKPEQLSKKDRNPFVLNPDLVQWNRKSRPLQRLASFIEARQSTTQSYRSPNMTYLYPVSAHPSHRGKTNYTPVFNDHGTHVPFRTKKKRTVNSHMSMSTNRITRRHKELPLEFKDQDD